ncbi:MAG: hypothetical protein KJ923_05300 [Candidatus Omnitrophica bacterium]|nr:hypothetical protein [Candidatus Omnitrophota bacterium]
MQDTILIFDLLRLFVLTTSPVVFIFGILLILYSNYKKLEEFLAIEMIKAKIFVPKLENNHFNFHQWLLEKRTIFGLVCIIYSVAVLYTLLMKV